LLELLQELWSSTGFSVLTYKEVIMLLVAVVLLYLGIYRKYEPLLLVPIAFGVWLANFPLTGIMGKDGLLGILYTGVEIGLYPPLIFMGVGALTDFGPLIANPRSLLLGAAAQVGIFLTFLEQMPLVFPYGRGCHFMIGGADGQQPFSLHRS